MKAVTQDRYGPADVLSLGEVDRPAPGAGQVLIRVHAAGVDRGVWHLMTGRPYVARLALGLRRPRRSIRGGDLAGVVEAVGEGASDLRPGDEVFGEGTSGTFAEFAVARADRVVRMPANLSFAQAAAVPTSAVTALQALRDHGRVQPGQRVLVIGAGGGVGTFAVQLAAAFGAHVTAMTSPAKIDVVRSLGADEVVDYTREDVGEGGRRFDLILDIGGNRPLRRLQRGLAPGGTLVFVGGEHGGPVTGGLGRQLRAALLAPLVRRRARTFVASMRRDDLETLRAYLASGELTPVVERTYPLAEVPDAVRHLERGAVAGKLVITV